MKVKANAKMNFILSHANMKVKAKTCIFRRNECTYIAMTCCLWWEKILLSLKVELIDCKYQLFFISLYYVETKTNAVMMSFSQHGFWTNFIFICSFFTSSLGNDVKLLFISRFCIEEQRNIVRMRTSTLLTSMSFAVKYVVCFKKQVLNEA